MSENPDVFEVAEKSALGSYYLFAGNTLATIILVVSSIIIARFLGPENYGLYSLLLVVPTLLVGLVDFGIPSALTRFLADYQSRGQKADADRAIKSGIILQFALCVIASILCFIFSDALATYVINTPEAGFYIKITSILVLFQSMFTTLSSTFVGLDMMEKNAFMLIIKAIIKLLLSLSLIFLGFNVMGALVGHIGGYIFAVGAGFLFVLFYLNKKNSSTKKSNSPVLKSMLKYGAALYVASLISLFMSQYQSIIMAFFVSKASIGNFQVTSLFTTAMTVLVYPFASLFPAFSKLDPKSKELNQFFRRSVKYTAIVLVPASIAISVLSTDFILAFYGPEYTLAPTFLSLFALKNLFAGIGSGVFPYLFNGIRRTDVTLKSSLVSLFVFVPLALVLTAMYDIVGLIVAYIATIGCSILFQLITAKKMGLTIDFGSSSKIFLSAIIAAICLAIFVILSPATGVVNLIFGAVLFLIMYLTLLPLVGAITSTDIKIFEQLLEKIKIVSKVTRYLFLYESKVLKFKNKKN